MREPVTERPNIPESNRVKVLYIAGSGRSGSTIIGNVLGQLEGFFSAGELRFIWERNLLENRLCGCGKPFGECCVWQEVLRRAFGGPENVDVSELIHTRESTLRIRHIPLALTPWLEPLLRPRLGGYLEALGRLYGAVADTTGSRVIVDSSKYPSYGYMLAMIPTIDLYVVHLVRDPRAVAYSWTKTKLEPIHRGDSRHMERHASAKTAYGWIVWSVAAEMFWKRSPRCYLQVRYEDFVDNPQEVLYRILEHVGERLQPLPLVAERRVRLDTNHTVSGNPNRFRTGMVDLRPDEEWKWQMKRADKAIVKALSWPLLLKYGYLGTASGKRWMAKRVGERT